MSQQVYFSYGAVRGNQVSVGPGHKLCHLARGQLRSSPIYDWPLCQCRAILCSDNKNILSHKLQLCRGNSYQYILMLIAEVSSVFDGSLRHPWSVRKPEVPRSYFTPFTKPSFLKGVQACDEQMTSKGYCFKRTTDLRTRIIHHMFALLREYENS